MGKHGVHAPANVAFHAGTLALQVEQVDAGILGDDKRRA